MLRRVEIATSLWDAQRAIDHAVALGDEQEWLEALAEESRLLRLARGEGLL